MLRALGTLGFPKWTRNQLWDNFCIIFDGSRDHYFCTPGRVVFWCIYMVILHFGLFLALRTHANLDPFFSDFNEFCKIFSNFWKKAKNVKIAILAETSSKNRPRKWTKSERSIKKISIFRYPQRIIFEAILAHPRPQFLRDVSGQTAVFKKRGKVRDFGFFRKFIFFRTILKPTKTRRKCPFLKDVPGESSVLDTSKSPKKDAKRPPMGTPKNNKKTKKTTKMKPKLKSARWPPGDRPASTQMPFPPQTPP